MDNQTVAGRSVRCLTRGEVRKIESLDGAEQTDLMVLLTLNRQVSIDDLPMPEYMETLAWAMRVNGLDGSAIANAKKN
jgi:hypothetical protein